MKIPNKFQVGGQTIEVVSATFDDDKLGNCAVHKGLIKIDNAQSEDSKLNTFLHELTHAVLTTMGEYDLNNNERFVCTFSGFLCEALKSFKYDTEREDKQTSR